MSLKVQPFALGQDVEVVGIPCGFDGPGEPGLLEQLHGPLEPLLLAQACADGLHVGVVPEAVPRRNQAVGRDGRATQHGVGHELLVDPAGDRLTELLDVHGEFAHVERQIAEPVLLVDDHVQVRVRQHELLQATLETERVEEEVHLSVGQGQHRAVLVGVQGVEGFRSVGTFGPLGDHLTGGFAVGLAGPARRGVLDGPVLVDGVLGAPVPVVGHRLVTPESPRLPLGGDERPGVGIAQGLVAVEGLRIG